MSLRILVINGFRSDADGLKKCKSFMRVVHTALRGVSTRAEFHLSLVGIQELEQFIYDPKSNDQTKAQALRNFSSTDISFIAGEGDLQPWHPKAALLLAYVNQCVMSGANVFGDEVVMRMVWHLACTCGRQLHVIDALNLELSDGSTAFSQKLPQAYSGSLSVMVDEFTGEAFQFADTTHKGEQEHQKHQDDEECAFPDTVPRNKAAPIRVCNVGMRKRDGHMAGSSAKKDSTTLTVIKGRGLEQHWLMAKIREMSSLNLVAHHHTP